MLHKYCFTFLFGVYMLRYTYILCRRLHFLSYVSLSSVFLLNLYFMVLLLLNGVSFYVSLRAKVNSVQMFSCFFVWPLSYCLNFVVFLVFILFYYYSLFISIAFSYMKYCFYFFHVLPFSGKLHNLLIVYWKEAILCSIWVVWIGINNIIGVCFFLLKIQNSSCLLFLVIFKSKKSIALISSLSHCTFYIYMYLIHYL